MKEILLFLDGMLNSILFMFHKFDLVIPGDHIESILMSLPLTAVSNITVCLMY